MRCEICHFVVINEMDLKNHMAKIHSTVPSPKQEAIRVTRPIRYDILDPEFLEMLAKIAHYGGEKYGDFNWQISRLDKDKSPINHIYKHLTSLRLGIPYDHPELGEGIEWHLGAIAFNAMMEFFWVMKEKRESEFPNK